MAEDYPIPSAYPLPPNVDLILRYCPGIEAHAPVAVARHIPNDPDVCWPWDGSGAEEGYGIVWCEPTPYGYRESTHVHRYMYDVLVGDIPDGYHVHHRCEWKPCWNPFHLKEVTPKEHCAEHGRGAKRPTYLCDARGQYLLFPVGARV